MTEIFDSDDVFIYIDDVMIAAETFSEFLRKLTKVFETALEYRITFALKKCSFQTKNDPVKVLGTIFQNGQKRIDPTRIDAIKKLPAPKTVKEIRSFIGSINFIREFLPNISRLIIPFTDLLKKKNGKQPRKISWSDELNRKFNEIKNMVSKAVPLSLPDPGSKILITTDASDHAIGGVVWQQLVPCKAGTPFHLRKVKPISFYSRTLTDSQKSWSTMQQELYAIVQTLNQPNLSSYLMSQKLTIFCDHKNITFLLTNPERNRVVQRWLPNLAMFLFDVVHTEGVNNEWADYLS
ncbi:hypothetical protein GEMRC1_002015 [Eukaryota sp. GEM-RC1]